MKKPDATLHPGESPKAGLLRIADGLFDCPLDRLRHRSRNPAEDIHIFRTTTKRLRALLQLIRPAIAAPVFRRETSRLKRAARRLAPFRDRSVANETIRALGKKIDLLCMHGLANPTRAADARCRTAMLLTARDLEMSRRAFHRLHIRGEGWAVIGPGLEKVYRQTRQRMKEACAQPGEGTFHRWRIRVKQLYHQLEWLEPVWPGRFGKLHKRLHALEEKLGADHDLFVLCELLEKMPRTLATAGVIAQVQKCAAKKSRRLRRDCMRLGARVLKPKPKSFRDHCERRWRAWEKRTR